MITEANWISAQEDIGDICTVFSKNIKITKQIKTAQISISATGVYEAEINGARVGDFILAPGLTSYKSRLQYQIYDVKNMLKNDNALSICLGKGWYRGRISENDKMINKS